MKYPTKKTQAQVVADLFGNLFGDNSMKFSISPTVAATIGIDSNDNVTLEDACEYLGAKRTVSGIDKKYAWADGSCIIVKGDEWDLGDSCCYCGWCWDSRLECRPHTPKFMNRRNEEKLTGSEAMSANSQELLPPRTLKQEQQDFDNRLPNLIKNHQGAFVLFKNGPVDFFLDMGKAFEEGLDRFGVNGTFVVHQVKQYSPTQTL